jgi:hypothetical protein
LFRAHQESAERWSVPALYKSDPKDVPLIIDDLFCMPAEQDNAIAIQLVAGEAQVALNLFVDVQQGFTDLSFIRRQGVGPIPGRAAIVLLAPNRKLAGHLHSLNDIGAGRHKRA